MLSGCLNDQARMIDRELQVISHSRPRYDREDSRRSRTRLRGAVRRIVLPPERATPSEEGRLADVVIRAAGISDGPALARLAEASERRTPSGLVLLAQVERTVVAALPADESYVLTDLLRPTSDVVQLLELRSEQLRAARLSTAA